ncbi:hypothetical protein AWENTII_013016 [Aspergillus wentii]
MIFFFFFWFLSPSLCATHHLVVQPQPASPAENARTAKGKFGDSLVNPTGQRLVLMRALAFGNIMQECNLLGSPEELPVECRPCHPTDLLCIRLLALLDPNW